MSAFPLLRPALLDLLQELPSGTTGLGATEMRLLDLIRTGFMGTNMLFYLRDEADQRSSVAMESHIDEAVVWAVAARSFMTRLILTFDDSAAGGLKEAYTQSRLSLTPLGEDILAGADDFSRHNPIHRWWGGTELTNDHLWRWDAANRVLIGP